MKKKPIELWDETKAEYLRWLALNPLEGPERGKGMGKGDLFWIVAVAVAWCVLLVVLVSRWTVPVDMVIGK